MEEFEEIIDDIHEAKCMVPESDGILSSSFKESLWDRYYMGAPKQHRRFVEQYKIEKRA
ncbi:hypothetical protein [Wolbachia endosymbiont (group A) of Campoletis raptor]|uniref:hypothetical protein n=1 Tax=Wolbachia endosymbiont (group A) of Campoletis raptor TaxID=3066196 RepID=UPI003132DB1A